MKMRLHTTSISRNGVNIFISKMSAIIDRKWAMDIKICLELQTDTALF